MELVASLFNQNHQPDANGTTSPPGSRPVSPESSPASPPGSRPVSPPGSRPISPPGSRPGSSGSARSVSSSGSAVEGGDIESHGGIEASTSWEIVPYAPQGAHQPYNEYNQNHQSSNINGHVHVTPSGEGSPPRAGGNYVNNQSNDVERGDIPRGMSPPYQTIELQTITPAKSQGTDDTFMDSPVLSPASSTDSRPTSPKKPKSPKRSRRKLIRFSSVNEVRTFTPSPEEFQDHPKNVFKSLHNTRGSRLRHFLTVRILPFTYGAISSITTIYFFLELMVRYTLNKEIIGVYLAAAYLTRVVFTSISRVAPKSCILLGSLLTLLGFLMVALSQRPSYIPVEIKFQDDGLTWFIAGSILACAYETNSGMEMIVRDQCLDNVKAIGIQLKNHYLMTKIARVLAFAGLGFLYQYYNVEGVALLGAGLAVLQIMFLCIFFILDIFRIHYDPNNAFGEDFIDLKPHCRPNCSIRAVRGKRRMFKSTMSKLNRTLSKYYPSDLPQSVLRRIIPLCVFGRTLSSVCIWGSSALLIFDDYTQNFIVIGLIFAGAAACDFIVSFVLLTNRLETKLKKLCPSPRDLFLGMFGITLSSTLVAVPIYPVFLAGFMIYCVCNGLLRIVLTELQGSSENPNERVAYQINRRLWTAGSLYVIPILYNLHPRIPFVLGLWFAVASSTFLTIYMCCYHSGEPLDDVNLRKNKRAVTAAKNRPSRRPERNLDYAEQVMLGRLMKGKDV